MPALSSFHDVRFPTAISFGATGGPERRVEIVSLTSGHEVRNLRQANAMRRYDAGTGLRALSDIEEILHFFEARRGSFHAFRFRDPFDWKSCAISNAPTASDQILGTGDGTKTTFPLVKHYGSGADVYARPISCVVAATLTVSVDGVTVAPANYTIASPGRSITFKAGFVPANGKIVRAGFEFDVPVRFDMDTLTLSLSSFNAGTAQTISLKEVLL
jgi:uncharacterized protein (TIGR02217 family)